MARIRTIKPEFWTDPFLVKLEPLGRLMFMALLTSADDHGFVPDEPERLAMEVMPREDPLMVDHWIQLFEAAGKLERYVGPAGENFLKIKNWEKHQRVDKPSQSKLFREGSRKLAIPLDTRRAVAERYGCDPGGKVEAVCYYCGVGGEVYWAKLRDGRPSSWVTFPGLELDHLDAESNGGANTPNNIVLACRHCNRSKGTQHWFDFFQRLHDVEFTGVPREPSRALDTERKGKEGERKGKGREGNGSCAAPQSDAPPAAISIPLQDKSEYPITQDQVDEWQQMFPAIDVMQQLRAIREWNLSNPANRKTRNGARRHITGWLTKEQNRAPRVGGNGKTKSDDFKGKDYAADATPESDIPWLNPR